MDYKQAYEEAQETIKRLDNRIAQLERDAAMQNRTVPSPHNASSAKFANDAEQVVINLDVKTPELNVTVRRFVIEMNDEDVKGRLAILLYEGVFDQPRRIQDLYPEFRARAWMKQTGAPTPLNLPLAKLAEMGFLRIVGSNTYQSVPDMKVNIKEVRTVA